MTQMLPLVFFRCGRAASDVLTYDRKLTSNEYFSLSCCSFVPFQLVISSVEVSRYAWLSRRRSSDPRKETASWKVTITNISKPLSFCQCSKNYTDTLTQQQTIVRGNSNFV